MKYIHINRNVIQHNEKHNRELSVCRVQEGSKARYGSAVEIHGPKSMVYRSEKPLSCGAKLWIETDSEITIEDECTYKDIQKMK